jgi:C4-dicarboxylate-binding protein DctP
MMKKKILIILIVLMILSIFNVSIIAKEEYVLKYGTADIVDPFSGPTPAYASVFKSEVERLSGGKIKVELYPNAQLGDQRSMTEQVRQGTLESCNIASGVLASLYYEKLGIFDMPFTFSSAEVIRRVVDVNNTFTKKMIQECAEKTDIRILSVVPLGFRHVTNNVRPIHTPDDMEGLKIRTMEVVPHIKLFEALGANPTPIPFYEVYTSLQTNVVDGQENPFAMILAQKFYQVQDYLTLTGHVYGICLNIISEKWLQTLPEELKEVVIEADRVAAITFNGMNALVGAVGLEEVKEKGMEVYAPSAEEIAMFREKAVPAVKEWMSEQFGSDFVEEYLAVVKQAEEEIKAEIYLK